MEQPLPIPASLFQNRLRIRPTNQCRRLGSIRIIRLSQRFPRNGTGAIYGQSVSSTSLSSGTSAKAFSAFLAFLKVSTPVKPMYIPSFSTSLAVSALPEKQCTTPRGRISRKMFT